MVTKTIVNAITAMDTVLMEAAENLEGGAEVWLMVGAILLLMHS